MQETKSENQQVPAARLSRFSRLAPFLRCPLCTAELEISPVLRCSREDCDACRGFPTSKGQPVLIAFDQSIFTPDLFTAGEGQVLPRRETSTKMGRMLRRMTYGTNSVSSRVASNLLKLLHSQSDRSRVLVIGGGTIGEGLDEIYRDSSLELVGTDAYASDNTLLVCDAHDLPFKDESFDAVIIQAVLEHVLEPARVVDEIYRVLKPRGVVYADTPFMQQVHEGAYDFTRFTKGGHRWLFRQFDEVESGTVGGPGVALLWSIGYYLRSLGAGPKLVALITAAFFWVRLFERFADPHLAADAASGFYFIGRKSDEQLLANAIPSLYRSSNPL